MNVRYYYNQVNAHVMKRVVGGDSQFVEWYFLVDYKLDNGVKMYWRKYSKKYEVECEWNRLRSGGLIRSDLKRISKSYLELKLSMEEKWAAPIKGFENKF